MNFLEIIKISFQAIKTNKIRSFLTTLGIIIGVSSVILLVSIGSGLQSYVTKQFQSLGSNNLFVMPGKINTQGGGGGARSTINKLEFQDAANIEKLGEPIVLSSIVLEKTATIKFGNKTSSTTIIGIDDKYHLIGNLKVQRGKLISRFQVSTAKSVADIGSVISKNLKAKNDLLGEQITIADRKFTVIGINEEKGGGGFGPSVDDSIYIPYSTYRKLFSAENPSMITVKVSSEQKSLEAQNMIKKYYFEKRKLTEDDFTVIDQKELLNTINQFLGVITVALGGIAAISLLVGGIGIMNIMLVSVTERTKEIGLRKAIGATPANILIQFLIEALVLSLVGGALGIALGFAGSLALSRAIETQVTWQSIAMAFGVSSFVGIFFGVAPAVKASRLSPIEALRYE